jgi:PAS domain S-box-containing protein
VTSIVVMLLMRGAFFTYEFVTFRQATMRQLSTLGEILAANSTAALAFDNQDDAREILSALQAERHVVAAALYGSDGRLFAKYPDNLPAGAVPPAPGPAGYGFAESHLSGFQPVIQKDRRLGTLYLKFDTGLVMHEWLWGSFRIALAVMAVVLLVAYLLSRALQKQISEPILALTGTARAISERRDYSVRAPKLGEDELGLLTDAFNQLLVQIHAQKTALDEHAIVAITDQRGRITYVNDKFCAISKYSRDELLGQDHRLINSGHHPKEFIRDLWTSIAQGRVWHGEIKNRAKDGTSYWVDTTIVPFLKPDGKPYEYVAIRADITARKLAEEALATERTLLRTLIDLLPDYIYVKDARGRFLTCNAACARLMGAVTPAALTGKTDADFYANGLAVEFRADELAVIEGTPLIDKEEPFIDRNGIREYILTTKLPLRDKSGKVTGLVGYGRNVTAAKLAEESIRRLNAELEQRVVERTVQLEVANKELEAFSYSVSHDLRAPLRHIDGFAGLLVKSDGSAVSERGRGYLSQISASAKQMGALIDDLLVFSRMARNEMNFAAVDLGRLLDDTIRALHLETLQRNIRWQIGPLPVVPGDQPMLRQVFVNLLTNAIKYTRPRDPAEIEIGCRDESADEVVIYVRDNGVGFEMEYANKLFGVFQRLHRAEDFEGTGIGLANIRRIVTRHGGRTWAEGKPDAGATFYFTLPKSRKPPT